MAGLCLTLLFLPSLLGILCGVSSAPAAQPDLWFHAGDGHGDIHLHSTTARLNATSLIGRSGSLSKREVFNQCSNGFAPLLGSSLQDAHDILSNMVAHLELAVGLFDAAGEFLPDKGAVAKRTFDENNAMMSYYAFIARPWFGVADSRNRAGYKKMVGTLDLARAIKEQLRNYLEGIRVPWTTNGIPYVSIYCNDLETFSPTNQEGYTYTEDTGNPNRKPDKPKRYWVSASQESIGRDNVWYGVPGLCNHADVKSGFTNPAIPVFPTGVRGITFPSRDGLAEEKILFCPTWQPSWTAFDNARTNDGLHYRAMHVPIGGTPTERQRELARDLASNGGRNVMWFKNFFVKTLIHESTHATAFTTTRSTKLVDVYCTDDKGKRTGTPSGDMRCQIDIAKGVNGKDPLGNAQGHLDAECFATYAIATYINNVLWFKNYRAQDRG
ncbi:hypothetical protein C8A01DRAFT_18101 [Parachaetomium inaequale]|uniref:Uncharacterized protein n=1 Tax=Parachaetomium inaequale TaxID=2588326 RepID=A0AAN6PB70_9PEZI|nr:hypothetical protein C8A01DRAFT_18101 [Parachaetomium inaequale]